MAGQMRLGKQAQSRYATSAGELVPLRFADGSKTQLRNNLLEQCAQKADTSQRLCAAPVRIHDPFDPVHIREEGSIIGRAHILSRICWLWESAYRNWCRISFLRPRFPRQSRLRTILLPRSRLFSTHPSSPAP
jgi:hypothetical protein